MSSTTGRVFGLDLMRATAILLVVFWHCIDALGWFVPVRGLPPYIDGVDLFFVLSGFLIGTILLKYATMQGVPWWRRLHDFWQRRWLRTLPNYYLFLIANIILLHFGITNGLLNINTLAYFAFLQNLWKQIDLFFWESWSLSVEEWFYLGFPIVVAAGAFLLRRRTNTAFLAAIAAFIVAPTIVRLGMAAEVHSIWDLEQGARKLVLARLDTIGFGLLAAFIAMRAPLLWRKWRWPLFVIGLAGVILNSHAYGFARLAYSSTWFFTANAVAMAVLLPMLSTWQAKPRWGGPVVFISKVSYAFYLVHQPLRAAWNRLFAGSSPTEGVLLWIAYWVVSFFFAWLVYRFWEKRFMDMRDRIGGRLLV